MQWEHLKQIKQEFKHVVYGYIRLDIQPLFADNMENPYYIIPELVYSLCLLFWYQAMDEFDAGLLCDIVEISNENKKISTVGKGDKSLCTCYGSVIIPSMSDGSYSWKFKNWTATSRPYIYVGIDNGKEISVNSAITNRKTSGWYTLFPSGTGKSFERGLYEDNHQHRFTEYRYKESILNMRLTFDGDKGKLYYKNGKDDSKEQLVFDDIERRDDLKYRMVVSIRKSKHCIELLDYKQF